MVQNECLIFVNDNMGKTQRTIKRCCDIVLSFIALVLLSPIFLIIILALKFSRNGSVFYSQERIGYEGMPFTLYKFRTIKEGIEKDKPQLVPMSNGIDSTPLEKFLRAHHLDELPQFWNVLKGDMSLVGPRPERKYFIDLITAKDPNYILLYQMRPGLTSEATIYNGYTDTMEKMLKRLKMDINYLRNRTLSLDLQIIINTFWAIVSGKKF
ncbi:MAG: sugar transferase [Prevotella sp.]|nr:sugar transferase [Candidatus Equicola stercoris]